jgi:hypothetical protein
MAWHAKQFFEAASAWSAKAGQLTDAAAIIIRSMVLNIFPSAVVYTPSTRIDRSKLTGE